MLDNYYLGQARRDLIQASFSIKSAWENMLKAGLKEMQLDLCLKNTTSHIAWLTSEIMRQIVADNLDDNSKVTILEEE